MSFCESALDLFLKFHKRSCTYFIYSGDRHCSCGRDRAAEELEELRRLLAEHTTKEPEKDKVLEAV